MSKTIPFPVPKGHTLFNVDGDRYFFHRADGSVDVVEHNSLPSKTKQEFAAEVDINNIMKPYTYDQLPDMPGIIGEFSQLTDFHERATQVAAATSAFNRLPGFIRQRFNQDPVALTKFLENEDNYEEALKLGLVNPREEVKPDEALAALKDIAKNTTKKTKVVEID